jgi:hypothetical protein
MLALPGSPQAEDMGLLRTDAGMSRLQIVSRSMLARVGQADEAINCDCTDATCYEGPE